MRIIPFAISAVATILLIFLLNKKWGAIPPLGKFLSPAAWILAKCRCSERGL